MTSTNTTEGDAYRRTSPYLVAVAVIVKSAATRAGNLAASALLVLLAIGAGSRLEIETARASSVNVPVVQVATRFISSAEIQAIAFNAPLEIVPSPGAGRGLVVVSCEISVLFGTMLYTNSGNGAFALSYGTTPGVQACSSNFASALTAVSANSFLTGTNNGSLGGFTPNAPIRLAKALSQFTGGDGTIVVSVAYFVVPTQ